MLDILKHEQRVSLILHGSGLKSFGSDEKTHSKVTDKGYIFETFPRIATLIFLSLMLRPGPQLHLPFCHYILETLHYAAFFCLIIYYAKVMPAHLYMDSLTHCGTANMF